MPNRDTRTQIVLGTVGQDFIKAADTDLGTTSFASLVPTTTEPTGNGVIDFNLAPTNLAIVFYGSGSDDGAFDARYVAWHYAAGLWFPTILFQAACTLSTAVGVSGATVANTGRFADTITLTLNSAAGVDAWAKSPANNTIATVLADGIGARKFQFIADLGSNCTGANSLVKGV